MPFDRFVGQSLLKMPDGGLAIEADAGHVADVDRRAADRLDEDVLDLRDGSRSAPLPRMTNDMLPRGSTLPPAAALFVLHRVDHVAERQAVARRVARVEA